jgi:hypothetical protein
MNIAGFDFAILGSPKALEYHIEEAKGYREQSSQKVKSSAMERALAVPHDLLQCAKIL